MLAPLRLNVAPENGKLRHYSETSRLGSSMDQDSRMAGN